MGKIRLTPAERKAVRLLARGAARRAREAATRRLPQRTRQDLEDTARQLSAKLGRDILNGRSSKRIPLKKLRAIVERAER